jgi:hypothetical protein
MFRVLLVKFNMSDVVSFDTVWEERLDGVQVARDVRELGVRAVPGCVWGEQERGSYDSTVTAYSD